MEVGLGLWVLGWGWFCLLLGLGGWFYFDEERGDVFEFVEVYWRKESAQGSDFGGRL